MKKPDSHLVHTDKTRALKKYEADPAGFNKAGSGMEVISPFGPMIAKFRVPDPLVQIINRYADGIVSSDTGSEFILPEDVVDDGTTSDLRTIVSAFINQYLAVVENTGYEAIEFEVFWIVSQYCSTASPVHFHSGDISGVLFLKVPEVEEDEEIKTYISGRQAGYLNFLIGGKQRFSRSLVSFKPHPGDFYIFPGWLLHGAEPFLGKGERRSLSFNASIKPG